MEKTVYAFCTGGLLIWKKSEKCFILLIGEKLYDCFVEMGMEMKKRMLLAGGIAIIVAVLAFYAWSGNRKTDSTETIARKTDSLPKATELPAATEEPSQGLLEEKEKEMYTFLQGPKSWGKRLPWSGEWGTSFYDGGSFGGFGCGLCCIANIYSSLTKYQCTPVDAYRYAKRETEYGGGAAIAWGYIRRTLDSLGFACGVRKKPETYREFQKDIRKSQSAIVLVSSADSKCYWKETPGHYVTVFLYDSQSDSIFLADSGDPEHNRERVPLKKIYKSLKTASEWQYLLVGEYDKKEDKWRHKKAEGNWVRKEAD